MHTAPGIEWFGQPIGVGKDKSLPRSIQRKMSHASVAFVLGRRISFEACVPIFLIALQSMDNFEFWIYIIIAIIYLVSKAIQKSSRQSRGRTPASRPQDPEETEQLPPITFEELLREITEGKKRKAEAPPPQPASPPPALKPVAQERREYVDYDDEIQDEEKSLERVDYDREREASTLQVYERAKREAELKSSLQTLKSELRGIESLETLKSGLRGIESTIGTTRGASKRHWLLQEYVRELKTPSGFRKAVVMSEILKPKF
jgi:hypothetical protein